MTRFLFHELRKIALGEFFDDLGLEQHVLGPIGIDIDSLSITDEKVGEDRLGGGANVFSNFGATMILTTALFIFILIIVLLVIHSCKNSKKCKERIQKLKQRVFWNPMIRYFILNLLKLYMAAFVVLKAPSEKETIALLTAIAILFVVTLSLYLFYRVLKRQNEKLKNAEIVQSIGSLYIGKNVHDEGHSMHVYQVLFFLRRGLFVVATVYLFDYPHLQMIVHQMLTLTFGVYIVRDTQMYATRSQKMIEIGSEFILHCISITLSQYLNVKSGQDAIENLSFVLFGLLFFGNLGLTIGFAVKNC